ncbi:MAG: hypothetical protein Q9225_006297 [Loekoesia sp. 1 TL-2023]
MADHAKEERLMTVLAARFDKGSYLYLYKNKDDRGGRLEIANYVGKPEQDAFTWTLDSVKVHQSHKHPTLCTITVDGNGAIPASPPIQHPEYHWRLPNTDPRNEGKYLFRLHTLDIYFWTAADATSLMDALERMLEPQQVEITDRLSAPAAHEHLMSPVVQKLENVAIEDSAYQDGKTRDSRPSVVAFAPPPTVASSNTQETPKSNGPDSFKPLAYNPAAPPAPEPIKHREKTPPPPEAEHEGTGLSAAAYNDHAPVVSPLSHPSHSSLSQPPYPTSMHSPAYSSPQTHGSPYASPPPFAGLTGMSPVPDGRAGSMSSLPPPPPQGVRNSSISSTRAPSRTPSTQVQGLSSATSQQPTFSLPPLDPNSHYAGGSQPLDSPSAQILGKSYVGHPPQPLQHLQPQYADYFANRPQQPQQGQAQEPIGGYSNYNYAQPHHHHHHQSHQPGNESDVHSQLYRPTEEETHHHKHHRPSDGGQPTGRLEQQAGRIDKGVNRFFKKLEKRIG